MSRIWLVRHGPTHAKTMVGWTDLPADLSDTGAIARLRDALPDAPIVSSDLTRARTTADALQGARPRLADHSTLREMHFGDWENKTWQEIDAADPARARALFETPGHIAPPGGESWDTLCARVIPALEDLSAGGDVIVVAHFGVILAALAHVGGWSAKRAYSETIAPLSLSQVQWADRKIEAINQEL